MYDTIYLVTLAKRLRNGDDGNSQIRIDMKGGQVVKVSVYFEAGGYMDTKVRKYVVVRTEEQQLPYDGAKRRCELLGGDLPNLINADADGYEPLVT